MTVQAEVYWASLHRLREGTGLAGYAQAWPMGHSLTIDRLQAGWQHASASHGNGTSQSSGLKSRACMSGLLDRTANHSQQRSQGLIWTQVSSS